MVAAVTVGSRTHGQSVRADIDAEAAELVTERYRAACRTRSHDPFAAALSAYLGKYPQISKAVAREAVAYILATADAAGS